MPQTEACILEEIESVFTDRVDEQKIFNSVYNSIKKNEYEIINFWGIPGIGKSYLGKHLQGEVKRRGGEHSYINIDFNKNMKEIYEYLEDMATTLTTEKKYVFPVFSVALSYYYYHCLGVRKDVSSIESSFKNRHPFLYKLISPAIATGGFNSTFSSIAGLINAVKDSYGQEMKEHLVTHEKELTAIEKYDLSQLEKKLPLYFSVDYNVNVRNEEYPIVIFLDTYEGHVNELACVGYEYENDRWLRDFKYGIASRCNYTLWVITGREKVRWEELDTFWQGKIRFHEMVDFSDDYAREYLKDKGITDYRTVAKILSAAKGVPFHLYLSVEFYYQQIKAGVNADEIDFGRDYEDIFSRYIRYMNDDEKLIVYLMSCMGRWKKEDFDNYSILTSGAQLTLERVHRLSFVKSVGNNEYYLHAEAEDILRKRCPEYIKQLYYKSIMTMKEKLALDPVEEVLYFSNKIRSELIPMYISANELAHSEEVASIKRDVNILEESFYKNRPLLEKYLLEKEYSYFVAIISLYLKVIEDTIEPDEREKRIFVDILRIALAYFLKREWHQNAVVAESRLIELLMSMSSTDEKEMIEEQYRKYSMMIMSSHDSKYYAELESLYEESRKVLGDKHNVTKGIHTLLDFSNTMRIKEYDIDVVERFVAEEKRLYGSNSPRGIKGEMVLAYAYKKHEKFEEAVTIGEQLLSKMDCWLEEYDIDYMHAIDNLAAAYHGYGRKKSTEQRDLEAKRLYEKGYELAKRVFDISKRKGLENEIDKKDCFWYLIRIIESISLTENYGDAEEYCNEALKNEYFATADKDTKLNVYDIMACVYINKSGWLKAAYYVKKKYEILCLRDGPKSSIAQMHYKRMKELQAKAKRKG